MKQQNINTEKRIPIRPKIKKPRKKEMDKDALVFLVNYGKRIKQKRKKCKKTIVEMAILLNTDQSRLSLVENGKINLTINEVYMLDKQMDECLQKN